MKIQMLVISVIGLSLTCTAWADDLPQIGYSVRTPVKDLVAKGYRWNPVDILLLSAGSRPIETVSVNREEFTATTT